jgi:hypothetical protein
VSVAAALDGMARLSRVKVGCALAGLAAMAATHHTNNMTARADNLTARRTPHAPTTDNLTARRNNTIARANNLTARPNNMTARPNNMTARPNNMTARANNMTAGAENVTAGAFIRSSHRRAVRPTHQPERKGLGRSFRLTGYVHACNRRTHESVWEARRHRRAV